MDYSGHFFTFGRGQKWSPEPQCPDLVTVGAVTASRGGGHNNIMDTENSEQGAFKSSLGREIFGTIHTFL